MRNVVKCLVALTLVTSAGCVVKVNGKVQTWGLDGEKTEGAKPDGSATPGANTDELAAALAAGATPSGKSVELKPNFGPNPMVVGTFATKGEVNVRKQPHGVENCSGFVGETPAAIIKFTSSMKQTRISAPGAKLIVAEFGDHKYICDDSYSGTPSVMLNPEWPAGDDIKIYVGGGEDKAYTYQVKVEDETRPVDILWKDKGKQVELAEVPKEPLVYTEKTLKEPGTKGRCGDSFFRENPDVVFNLKRPLGDMWIDVRSAKPIDVQLVGPLNESGRNYPTRCGSGDQFNFGRMEAGTYGLRIGTRASGEEVLYHMVVRGKDTKMNPVMPPTTFPDDATVEESDITYHFPQLSTSQAQQDANREPLFLATPKQIYVFPKFNMDSSVAQAIGVTGDKTKLEYPKENEPMLLVANGRVMGADGAQFSVNMKDLQANPGAAIVIPAAPRNNEMSFDAALNMKGPEDAKAIAAYEKVVAAEDACSNRPRSWWEAGADAQCASFYTATDKARAALEVTLAKSRKARRATSLAKLKTRLETIFK